MVCYICNNPSDFICSICGVSVCKGHCIFKEGKPVCQTCTISGKK